MSIPSKDNTPQSFYLDLKLKNVPIEIMTIEPSQITARPALINPKNKPTSKDKHQLKIQHVELNFVEL